MEYAKIGKRQSHGEREISDKESMNKCNIG
jgi:hypothetical protein